MIVRMDGKYTTGRGDPVRILCVDAEGDQPVIGIHVGSPWSWSIDGKFNFDGEGSTLDLIEVTPPPPSPLAAAARKVVELNNIHVNGARVAADLNGWLIELNTAIAALESALKDEENAK